MFHRLQLKQRLKADIFEPRDFEFDYKVIVTKKKTRAKNVLMFHNGRGSQEGIIGELKSGAQFDYIPCRNFVANQHFMMASILSHNLGRELQMASTPRKRGHTWKRAGMWVFKKLATLRYEILLRAGRLTRPGNNLALTMSGNKAVQLDIEMLMKA